MTKTYSIEAIFGKMSWADNIVVGKNSKEALKSIFPNAKIKKATIKLNNATHSVVDCDEKGRLNCDRRKWHYYEVKE
jgi:ABC-type branched-subunit amino acid transport system ATPase component